MSMQTDILALSPLAYYPCTAEDASLTQLRDASGNGYHMTAYPSRVSLSAGALKGGDRYHTLISTVSGTDSTLGAYPFELRDPVAADLLTTLGDFTFSAIVKIPSGSTSSPTCLWSADAAGESLTTNVLNSVRLSYVGPRYKVGTMWEYGSGTNIHVYSATELPLDEFFHLVVRRVNATQTLTVVVNGQIETLSYSGNPELVGTKAQWPKIGGTSVDYTTPAAVSLAQICFWNSALSDADIASLVGAWVNNIDPAILNLVDESEVLLAGNAGRAFEKTWYSPSAAKFEDAGDYLYLPDSDAFDLGAEDFTIECMVHPTGYGDIFPLDDPDTISDLVHKDNSYRLFLLGTTNSYTKIGFDAKEGATISRHRSSRPIKLNQWYHVAVSKVGTQILLFLNGCMETVADQMTITPDNSSDPIFIGGNNGADPCPFRGYIDNVRITKGWARYQHSFLIPRQITSGVLKVTGQAPPPPVEPPPSDFDPYWDNVVLLVNGDADYDDSSPSAHTLNATGNANFSTAQKKYGAGSLYFDGIVDLFTIPDSVDLNFGSGDFTIEMDVRLTSIGPQTLFQRGGAANYSPSWLSVSSISSPDAARFLFADSSSSWAVDLRGTTNVADDTWHHLAVTRNGSTFRLFVDGVQEDSATSSAAQWVRAGLTVIGSDDNLLYCAHGYIDNLRITKGVARYTTNFTPPTAAFPTTGPAETDPYWNNVVALLHLESDGTNEAGPDLQVGSPAPSYSLTSRFGVYSLSGSGVHTTNTIFQVGLNDFTWEAWVSAVPGVTNDYWAIITSSNSNIAYIRFADSGAGNHLQFAFNELSSWNNVYSCPLTKSDFTSGWRHIALSRKEGKFRLFVDGVRQTLATGSSPGGFSLIEPTYAVSMASNNFIIGNVASQTGYPLIDEVRFTKGNARYWENFTPPTAAFPTTGPTYDQYWNHVQLLAPLSHDYLDTSEVHQPLDASTAGPAIATATPINGLGYADFYQANSKRIVFPSSPAYHLPEDFTLEFWVRIRNNTDTTHRRVMSRGIWPQAAGDWIVTVVPSNKQIGMDAGPSVGAALFITADNSAGLTANTWHHVAFSRRGTVSYAFLDGVLAEEDLSFTADFTNSRPFTIGADADGTDYFDGAVAGIRLTQGVARYTANFDVPAYPYLRGPEPVTDPYWDQVALLLGATDRSATPVIDDASGDRLAVTNTAVEAWATNRKFESSAFWFTGQSSYLTINDLKPALTAAGPITIECWVKLNATKVVPTGSFNGLYNGSPILHLNKESGGAQEQGFYINPDNVLAFARSSGWTPNNFSISIPFIPIVDKEWTHVAFVFDGTYATLYVNGVSDQVYGRAQVAQGYYTSIANVYLGANIPVGYLSYSSFFNGQIDEFRVTNAARYTADFTPSDRPSEKRLPILTTSEVKTLLPCSADLLDDSAAQKTIVALGTTAFSSGAPGPAAYIGASQTSNGLKIGVASDADFVPGAEGMTLECWYYQTANTEFDFSALMTKVETASRDSSAATSFEVGITKTGNFYYPHVQRLVTNSQVTSGMSPYPVSLNAWNHIALVIMPDKGFRLFSNGRLVAAVKTVAGSYVANTSPFLLGASYRDNAYRHCLNGYIKQFRLTRKAVYVADFTPSATYPAPV